MIYTKKGDRGKTSLLNGRKIFKNSKVIEAIGSIDELNSYLGIIRSINKEKFIDKQINKIQRDLFLIGSLVAGYNFDFDKKIIVKIEEKIDELEAKLPVQTHFVFFGGNLVAAELFYARSLARKAERRLVDIRKEINPLILVYINRLSDYLFILGRWCNFRRKIKEEIWTPF